MYRLTTFEKIGDEYDLSDDIIDKISDLYMKDCFSYKNTLKYHIERQILIFNNDYHYHRIRMHLVDCEFKNSLRSFLSYQNLLLTLGSNNISSFYMNRQHEDMLFDILFNISLETHMKHGMGNFIRYLKTNKT